jgi:uncharacterized protein (TIGR04255 family)
VKRSLPPLGLDKSKTPLIFALAQVRVAPIAKIETFLPAIQETLRHQGFPQLQKRKYEIEQQGVPAKQERIQWELLNKANTRSILIDESSLVLQTTDYDTGDAFLADLKIALEAFYEHAKPTDLLRVGLRYVDLIKPIQGLGLDQLVSPALRPPVIAPDFPAAAHLWQSLRSTGEKTKLLIRYTEALRGIAFPPDIGLFITLNFKQDPNQQTPFGLLDTDHFDESPSAFDVGNTVERVGHLHDILDQIFRKLVTPAALEVWQ